MPSVKWTVPMKRTHATIPLNSTLTPIRSHCWSLLLEKSSAALLVERTREGGLRRLIVLLKFDVAARLLLLAVTSLLRLIVLLFPFSGLLLFALILVRSCPFTAVWLIAMSKDEVPLMVRLISEPVSSDSSGLEAKLDAMVLRVTAA